MNETAVVGLCSSTHDDTTAHTTTAFCVDMHGNNQPVKDILQYTNMFHILYTPTLHNVFVGYEVSLSVGRSVCLSVCRCVLYTVPYLDPMKGSLVLYAESGDGCDEVMTTFLRLSIEIHLCCVCIRA